jgi:phospholipid/cholesterol/gamma-HCH transport system substrate-binding protein
VPRSLRWRDLIPGLLVFGALLFTTAATLKYARIGRITGDTIRYYAAFAGARNVMGGTEVWINGAKVGRVKRVAFADPSADSTHRVVLELEVREKFRDQIRENSSAQLRTGAKLMGPTVLYITAGTSDARIVPEDDTIVGTSGGDIQAVTASFGEVAREFPEVMANVKMLTASLSSTRGTIGALTTLDAPKRFEALVDNASRLTDRARSGKGTLGLAMERGALIARAKAASAQADSVRALLASDRTSFGRFRRDSTLLDAVAAVRDELSIAQALLAAQPGGTLSRFGQDSIIAVQTAERARLMGELVADIKRRPMRYLPF